MADRDRDRHVRDSGLPLNDNSLITITGGDGSTTSDTDSDELVRNFLNPAHPPRSPTSSSTPSRSPSPTNMAQPVAPGQVRPQQLANIPLFDGERGEGFVNWG